MVDGLTVVVCRFRRGTLSRKLDDTRPETDGEFVVSKTTRGPEMDLMFRDP